MEIAVINDDIVPIDAALISPHDRGLFFGDGVYEVVLYRNGRLFAWDRHLQRLERSLREMQMLEKVDLGLVENRVFRAVDHAKPTEASVYFHITRGCQTRAHDWKEDWTPNFFLTVRPITHRHPHEAPVISHPDWRWKRCDIKSLNLLANVLARHAATRAGAYEAVLVDELGIVTEGTATSVFLIRGRDLLTAPLTANILPGITRGFLLEFASELGLNPLEQSFSLTEAFAADELFLTGTTAEVIGITALDGRTIGTGRLGQHSARLRTTLQHLIAGTTP